MNAGNIFDTNRKILEGISYLLWSDFSVFQATFPRAYLLLFFVIRVIPVMVLLFWVAGRVSKRMKLSTDFFRNSLAVVYQLDIPLFLIMATALALRVWYCTTPLSFNEGDAACRMEIARDWFTNPDGIAGGLIWPPLHFYLLMLPRYLGVDLLNSTRLVTVLFGVLSLPVLYLLVKERFDKQTALMACLLLAINPFHIKYSVIAMTEVPFLFFLLLSMLVLFRFIKTDKFIYLFLSSLCLNCSSMIRFEGWIVSALLSLYIIYYKKDWKYLFAFGAMNAVTILAYLVTSLKMTGHPIYGLFISNLEVRNNYEQIKEIVPHILSGLRSDKVFSYGMFIFVFHGIWLALKKKKELPWLFTACLLLGMIGWKIITCTNEPSWRYFSTGLFLLLPFMSVSILQLLPPNIFIKTGLIIAGIIFFGQSTVEQYWQLKEQPFIPAGLPATAAWMREHKKPGEKYLFNSAGTEFAPMRVYTNTVLDEMYFPPYPGMRKFDSYEAFTETVFLRTVRRREFKYMVYQRGLAMDSVFHLPWVEQQIQSGGPQFDSVYAAGNFRVYYIRH